MFDVDGAGPLLVPPAISGAPAEVLQWNQVMRQAEAAHPKLRVAELLLQVAEAKITEKEGAFDPALAVQEELFRYNSPTDPGKAKYAWEQSIAYQRQDVSGIKWGGGYRLNRGFVKAPDSLTGQGGEFFLDIKVPLLRGLGTNEKQTALDKAKLERIRARAEARAMRLDTLMDAAVAYWDWVAAATDYKLQARFLEFARLRVEQTTKRVIEGELPRIDITEAEQEYQRRLEVSEKSRRIVEKSALKLSMYLWDRKNPVPHLDQAPWLLPPEATAVPLPNVPKPPAPLTIDLINQAELYALEARPELMQLAFTRRSVELDKRLADNDRLPILDLGLSPGFDTGKEGIGPTYKLTLNLLIPLATRNADGRAQAAQLYFDKLDLDQSQEIRRVLTEVRDAASLIETSEARLAPSTRALLLALKLEEGERRKFVAGDSTVFLVNQRERATYAEAQKLIEIMADSWKARTLLEAAAGRL